MTFESQDLMAIRQFIKAIPRLFSRGPGAFQLSAAYSTVEKNYKLLGNYRIIHCKLLKFNNNKNMAFILLKICAFQKGVF